MATQGVTFSSDDLVIKSPTDRRLYRYIVLQNGLSALIVHDPDIYSAAQPNLNAAASAAEEDEDDEDDDGEGCEGSEEDDDDDDDDDDDEDDDDDDDDDGEERNPSKRKKFSSSDFLKKAAAAMCVGMGSFSDPYDAQGLAHFLEHMLFMGSAEFPDENEYDSYLSKHGGSSNAYTEMEHTCYHFEVKPEFLQGALQRFSQFFISPLVKSDAMEREVLAVDSEFNQVLQSDACRLQQLQCHTTVAGHPFNRFFWGNKKSLANAIEKGFDLREHILRLYEENYYGGVMKLVVIGGESLDVLEKWVIELFKDVKAGCPAQQDAVPNGPIWKSGKIYELEAVKDVHILDISWKLPCLHEEYLKKPEDYLAHLIGHEGRGSLHFFLKKKGWISSISAGVSDEGMYRSSLAYIFSISIQLTDCGLEKVYDIIGYVYQYLKLLRLALPQEWIFKELQDIGNMEFRFAEEQPQDDYAAELAETLLVYPAKHAIYGKYAHNLWDGQLIVSILNLLMLENMRTDVVSKLPDKSRGELCEPWFGSRYIEKDIPSSLMNAWRDPPEVDCSLHLPSENDFLPVNFNVHANDTCDDIKRSSYPQCILDEPLLKLWYLLDQTFMLPRACTYFRLIMNGAYESVKSCLLTELFVNLLKDELNETVYQASVAKLEASVSVSSDKLELKIYGFNDKLPVLLLKILQVAKNFLPKEDRFMVIKENMERALRNANMKPLNHASYLRLQILCRFFWDIDEKLQCLRTLSLTDLHAFIPKLLSQVYVEGLCHGNLLEDDVISISKILKSNLSKQPLPVETRHGEEILSFSSWSDLVRDVHVKNKHETNSVIELYYQIEQDNGVDSIRLKTLSDLFDEIVEEPFFNQLRTKEQLGYVVECSPRMTYRVFGFCFCVQSSDYDPIYLQERVQNFINGLPGLLDGLDNESFESFKCGLISKLLEKDPSLTDQANRYWNQIVDQRYIFDLPKKESEELKTVKKSDLIEWYNTYFQVSSPRCRRIAIRVWGCDSDWSKIDAQMNSGQIISDVAAFKKASKFYKSLC